MRDSGRKGQQPHPSRLAEVWHGRLPAPICPSASSITSQSSPGSAQAPRALHKSPGIFARTRVTFSRRHTAEPGHGRPGTHTARAERSGAAGSAQTVRPAGPAGPGGEPSRAVQGKEPNFTVSGGPDGEREEDPGIQGTTRPAGERVLPRTSAGFSQSFRRNEAGENFLGSRAHWAGSQVPPRPAPSRPAGAAGESPPPRPNPGLEASRRPCPLALHLAPPLPVINPRPMLAPPTTCSSDPPSNPAH